ncbi:MAG: hypothetical protein B7Y25_03155 [Alphaproteobacteria bacterium 16-39-46]|nr:MAG: hypothetical protein B7Y25_03155 [Alphaproteobacteria bacterium 16-39-46]OZA43796.1 MAG: hypothetical protein B7X84_02095 [Alphaproteobacteria bacterium 17-39-52]
MFFPFFTFFADNIYINHIKRKRNRLSMNPEGKKFEDSSVSWLAPTLPLILGIIISILIMIF